ncbi:uncharacterized protein F4822DRAFT_442806 [Hypoxylon trugodes]|uniref:uncharacterized protein n=1 Tax=Hypoxylon trugodes TaxID=326681 RepID=UPI0021930E6A|nr:uncharacterized protein F4822DRAFT_442806 [Hypoxylon trugodes]KAI1389576.1 hypothetical protein F4822DRAFT_442806 [Hypoxylon trugodes]
MSWTTFSPPKSFSGAPSLTGRIAENWNNLHLSNSEQESFVLEPATKIGLIIALWFLALFTARRRLYPQRSNDLTTRRYQFLKHMVYTTIDLFIILFCDYRMFENGFVEISKVALVLAVYMRLYWILTESNFMEHSQPRIPFNPFAPQQVDPDRLGPPKEIASGGKQWPQRPMGNWDDDDDDTDDAADSFLPPALKVPTQPAAKAPTKAPTEKPAPKDQKKDYGEASDKVQKLAKQNQPKADKDKTKGPAPQKEAAATQKDKAKTTTAKSFLDVKVLTQDTSNNAAKSATAGGIGMNVVSATNNFSEDEDVKPVITDKVTLGDLFDLFAEYMYGWAGTFWSPFALMGRAIKVTLGFGSYGPSRRRKTKPSYI